jgi:SAM-dependent methyltransferase
MTSPPAI